MSSVVCSANQDLWADPPLESVSAKLAAPVYQRLGTQGLARQVMAQLSQVAKSPIDYHPRPGRHGLTAPDRAVARTFANHHASGVGKPGRP